MKTLLPVLAFMHISIIALSQNVGIGTTSPAGRLHIVGAEWSITPVIIEHTGAGNVGPTLRFKGTSSTYDIIGATGTGAVTGANCFAIWDDVASAYRFVLTADGNIGIGTSFPSSTARVHVVTNAQSYTGYFQNNFIGAETRYGVYGVSNNNPGHGVGSRGEGGYMGGYFSSNAPAYAGQSFGVYGSAQGSGSGVRYGVYGFATGAATNYAGYFSGHVHVTGTLSKAAGTFRIDHPLDPANKYLSHSFVESPDMMNVYTGTVTTGANGEAIAQLPSYFQELNIDYTYQLTTIGQFAQAIVLREINNNQFVIKTDKPGVKVSWLVTGVRNDPYAKQNRVVPEQEKRAEDRGKYLNPEVYGLPIERAIAAPPVVETKEK